MGYKGQFVGPQTHHRRLRPEFDTAKTTFCAAVCFAYRRQRRYVYAHAPKFANLESAMEVETGFVPLLGVAGLRLGEPGTSTH